MKQIIFLSLIILLILTVGCNDNSENTLKKGITAYKDRNYQKAINFFNQSCIAENAVGCYYLGGMYYLGKGVPQNKSKAKEFFAKACNNGENSGCYNYNILDEQDIK